eukprot:PhF_6_TR6989/c1_g1_i2/m.10363/K00326/E1.6.2.2; cytochrome-b5 reductase
MATRRMMYTFAGCSAAIGASAYLMYPSYAYAKKLESIPPNLNLKYKPQAFPVIDVKQVSHDTKVVTFGLGEGEVFHLDAAQTLQCSVYDNGMSKRVTRHYTPISPNGTKGKFEVMVKKYEGGYMSPRVHALTVGDGMDWAAVPPSFVYKPNLYKNMYMIAGGVGITPMLQLIRTVLANPDDKTKMKLLFMNKTPEDILLKSELDALVQQNPDRLQITYGIDKPTEGWKGEVGHANADMISRTLTSRPKEGDRILLCGNDKMLTSIAGNPPAVMMYWSGKMKTQPTFQGVNNLPPVGGILGDMGWTNENCWRF